MLSVLRRPFAPSPQSFFIANGLPAALLPRLQPYRLKMWSNTKLQSNEFPFDCNLVWRRFSAARTYGSLLQAMRKAFAFVTADDAHGWFHSCGYTIP
jgi:hypothetical protein